MLCVYIYTSFYFIKSHDNKNCIDLMEISGAVSTFLWKHLINIKNNLKLTYNKFKSV